MRAVAASSPSGGASGGRRVAGRRLVGRRRRDDELGLAGAQPQLDRARRELARDLVRGARERIEQHQPDRRLQRSGQALGERAGVLAAGVGDDGEFATEVLDERGKFHDASMAPLWHHCNTIMVRRWRRPARPSFPGGHVDLRRGRSSRE